MDIAAILKELFSGVLYLFTGAGLKTLAMFAGAGIIVPMSAPLVGSLMFGNLIRECGVLERLSKTAQNELANLVTILLGVFLVLTLFFATIKLMQKIGTEK